MKFYSTRAKNRNNEKVSLSDAIMTGLAPDGGLYMPDSFPDLSGLDYDEKEPYSSLAYKILSSFAEGDLLESRMDEICRNAFDFPINLRFDRDVPNQSVLELFHGPTFAFKDFGARFLAESMSQILTLRNEKKMILVATSGDTGSAVGSAFHNKKNISVKILYPKGLVSARQKAQLCSFDGNVQTYEVDGTFDDCQKMVKDAFADRELNEKYNLSSANSINIARLLPQMTYYFYASLVYNRKTGKKPVIIVPTGNAGNVCAAYFAKICGAPIDRLFLACNENHSIPDYIKSGIWKSHPTIFTPANAMDVGNPSNMERLMSLFSDIETFRANVSAESVSSENIKKMIEAYYDRTGLFICPHTACAVYIQQKYFKSQPSVAVSTAAAMKFPDIFSQVLSKTPETAPALQAMLDKKQNFVNINKGYRNLF